MNDNNANTEDTSVAGLKEISHLLAKIDDEQLIWDFFECLFTAAERKDFSNRWLLVKEIAAGVTQREIAREFKMSLCKITRGSKELKKPHSAFKKMLDKLKDDTL